MDELAQHVGKLVTTRKGFFSGLVGVLSVDDGKYWIEFSTGGQYSATTGRLYVRDMKHIKLLDVKGG